MATTKREMFTAIRAIVADNEEMVAFIDHEIELLNRKSASPKKPTKTQIENEGYKADIIAYLTSADAPKTIKEMQADISSLAGLTNQRITHMLTDLHKDGKIMREYVKKVPYFAIGAFLHCVTLLRGWR